MPDWSYANEGDEDEEEQEDGDVEISEQRYGGRDSLIFLVDASKAMFDSLNGGLSPFELTLQCIRNVYTTKIISSAQDLLSVVFFGTREKSDTFKHVYVLHDLDSPGAKRVLDLDKYKDEKGRALFSDTIGHSADFCLGDALWQCSNLFSNVKTKMSHKRIMLFTNEDHPHSKDKAKSTQAIAKAKDLQETGIFIDLMHLEKAGGFDIPLFYRDIVNVNEDEDLGVHYEASNKLDDLLRKVRSKETKKRALTRLKLNLGNEVCISVGIFNLIQKAVKPAPVKLYCATNEPVKTKTRTFNRETGSLLLPSDTKRSQTYGNRQIVLEKEEAELLKKFDDPGLVLIGFKPLSLLKKHHFIRPAQFVYPDESLVNGFSLIFLPFTDDIRKVDFPEKILANSEQVDKMKEIVQKMRFKYRSDSFENPSLQQHFRNLEALALDMIEPEPIEDLTLPKVEMIDTRLGALVDDFTKLVYPVGYNPEGKTAKRKQGDGDGPGEKRAKTDISISEVDLKNHVKNGTLGKLTVPVLKEACRTYGLKGGKKQELMDALVDHLKKI
uniref:DNA helicase n=1 Tax=Leptobrachium leishanense TaxID=445787 RepID=A0A8C5QHA1_9ANUR